MRNLRLAVSMAVLSGAVTSPAFGQTTSSSNALGSTTGSSGANSVGTGTSTSGSGGTTGSASSGGASLATTTLATASTPPINPPASTQSASSNQAISPSNVFQYTYGAVYYQGRAGANTSSNNPGGLGTPLFTVTSGTGSTTTRGGGGGSTAINDSGGVMVPLPRNIAYPAQIKFARQPINTDRLQADLRGTISRSSSLSNPAGVQVQVVGTNVTVRGTVRNAEEARLVEGLIRLTPGVGVIQNELTATEP